MHFERQRAIDFSGINPLDRDARTREQLKRLSEKVAVPLIRAFNIAEGKNRKTVDYDVAVPDVNQESTDLISDLAEGRSSVSEIIAHVVINPPTREEWRRRAVLFDELRSRFEKVAQGRDGNLALQQETTVVILNALAAFCSTRGGEDINTLDLIEITQGIKPELVPESIIKAQTEKLQKFLKEKFEVEYTREALEEFRKTNLEPQFVEKMREDEKEFYKRISSAIGKQIDPDVLIDEDNEDDYWVLWSTGRGRKYKTTINTNKKHDSKKTKGRAEIVRDHERMHHGQAYRWRERIEDADLLPSLGVTSIVTPVQVTLEGIAQTIPYYLPEIYESMSPLGRAELELEGLRQLLYNNVHILVNSSDVTDEQVIAYFHQYYPAEPEDEIKRQIKDRRDDPFKRSYLYSYTAGYRLFKWFSDNLNETGKKAMLRFIFEQPTTPKQVYTYFALLMSDSKRRYGRLSVPYGENFDDLPAFPDSSN